MVKDDEVRSYQVSLLLQREEVQGQRTVDEYLRRPLRYGDAGLNVVGPTIWFGYPEKVRSL